MASFVDDRGVELFLGNLEVSGLRMAWPLSEAAGVPEIQRGQWKPVDMAAAMSPAKSQAQTSACNAFACVYALEALRRMMGLPDVRLSPGQLYGRINRGRDQGSYLEDGMQEMTVAGVSTAATVPELSWQQRTWPAGAQQEMASYRVLEAWLCPTFTAAASALQRGAFLVLGLMWCRNYTPGQGGWVPAQGGQQVGGHALCGCGLEQHPSGTGWGIKVKNSWGAQWGVDGGYGILPEPVFGSQIGGWWALRSPVQEQTDVPTPSAA